MNSNLVSFRLSRIFFLGVVLSNFTGFSSDSSAADMPTPPTTVEEQKTGISEAGQVEERGLSRAPMPGRTNHAPWRRG
jgi:hypothetical protein